MKLRIIAGPPPQNDRISLFPVMRSIEPHAMRQ